MKLIDPKAIDQLIDPVAVKWNLNPNWLYAIISTESGWNIHALKYESNYPYLYQTETCAKHCGATLATEIAAQKMSWGLAQVMGALAREQGFKAMMPELAIPEVNVYQLGMRLDYLKRLTPDSSFVFAAYNAGPGVKAHNGIYPNQAYVNKVVGFLKERE